MLHTNFSLRLEYYGIDVELDMVGLFKFSSKWYANLQDFTEAENVQKSIIRLKLLNLYISVANGRS